MGGEDKEILISSTSGGSCLEDDLDETTETNPYCDTTVMAVPKITLQNGTGHGPGHAIHQSMLTGHRSASVRIRRLIPTWSRLSKRMSQVWRFHWRVLVAMTLTFTSSSGCLIFFPKHLESVTESRESDGYSACLATVTMCTAVTAVLGISLKFAFPGTRTIFRPLISFSAIMKIGFSTGLSLLTIFYAWEDHKVLCNFQDPLLGLSFLFSLVTHAVSKWRELGFRRSFAMIAVAAGVFVSVDYSLVDHHRCRGHYYAHPPKDPWTWQVHLVWTLAFVVAIWLWTVAMFCMESALPQVKEKRISHIGDEYNAVRMKVIRVRQSGTDLESHLEDPSPPLPRIPEPDLLQTCSIQSLRSVYSPVSYLRVYNAVFWFHLAAWFIISSLFWTEFVPGFGKGVGLDELPEVLWAGLENSLSGVSSWTLVFFALLFSQSFAYLLLLIRSPLIAIGIACIGFPIVGLWWSLFQIKYNVFIWMPMVSGELICSLLSFPLILGGLYYLFRLDVLKLDYKLRTRPVVAL